MGLEIRALGVKPYPFGTCIVTSVGMMGLDQVFAPFTPWAHVPVLLAVGQVTDKAVVRDGQVAVRPILSLNATLDHRFLDGAQGAYMAHRMRQLCTEPELLDSPAE